MGIGIDRNEVFATNRDELFMSRLANDISKLEQSGFQSEEIKRMIGTFPYVRVWANTPHFLYPVLKLPKGYIWKMGEKFKCDYGCHNHHNKVTYVFLPIGKDLYIKGVEVPGTHISDPKIVYIKNYKKLSGSEVAQHFDYNLSSIILDYWHKNNLDLGYVLPVTRKFDITEAILKDYRSII